MSYGTYKPSLHRTGYRPYGQTNPWAAASGTGISEEEHAAHMAGLGRSSGFGPWTLDGLSGEGLDQNHPFTPAGGWSLHGLGATVPDGALVTYKGKWTSTMNAQELLSAVAAALHQDGLSITDSASDAGFLQKTTEFGHPLSVSQFGVTLKIQITNGMGFGDPADIIAIIRHEVYAASGQFPIADAIIAISGGSASGGGSSPYDPTLPPPADPSTLDLPTWMQNNFGWLALAAVGLAIGPSLLKRVL